MVIFWEKNTGSVSWHLRDSVLNIPSLSRLQTPKGTQQATGWRIWPQGKGHQRMERGWDLRDCTELYPRSTHASWYSKRGQYLALHRWGNNYKTNKRAAEMAQQLRACAACAGSEFGFRHQSGYLQHSSSKRSDTFLPASQTPTLPCTHPQTDTQTYTQF